MDAQTYQAFEHAGWERAAAAYADSFDHATRLFVPLLLDAAAVRDGADMLDVACGTGTLTAAVAARGARATGVDFSPAMVAEARTRHPGLAFHEADAQSLPFDAACFDAVLINFGVHHFPHPQRALAEARRVLRPGGRLAFTVWAPPEEHALHRISIEATRAAGDATAALPTPPQGNVNSPSACLSLLAAAGFAATASSARIERAILHLDGIASLVHMLREGTVRVAAMIAALPPDHAQTLVIEIERAVQPYRRGDGLAIPVAAVVATGVKS